MTNFNPLIFIANHAGMNLADAIKEAYEQGKKDAQPEQRWVSSGKKPLKEGSYLVWMPFAPPKHRMAVAEYCGGYWNIKTPISAWMPLPESYEEDPCNGCVYLGESCVGEGCGKLTERKDGEADG